MFIVLVRRCQEVRHTGRHFPMTTEWEQSSLVAFHSVLLSSVITFISTAIIIGSVVVFTAHFM